MLGNCAGVDEERELGAGEREREHELEGDIFEHGRCEEKENPDDGSER